MENLPTLLRAMQKGICPVFLDKQGYHPNGLSKQQLYEGVDEIFDFLRKYPFATYLFTDQRKTIVDEIVTLRKSFTITHHYKDYVQLSESVRIAVMLGLISADDASSYLGFEGDKLYE